MELSSLPLFVGALATFAMAALVGRASDGRAPQRWLTLLLALEGASLLGLGLVSLFVPFLGDQRHSAVPLAVGAAPAWAIAGYVMRDGAVLLLAFAYLMVLSFLDTPLARWLRRPWGMALAGLLLALAAAQPVAETLSELRGGPAADTSNLYLLGALIGLFALACSLHAYSRAPAGSGARRRAGAFALAFGAHDVATVASFGFYAAADGGRFSLFPYYPLVAGVGTVVFVVLLAYGFLRTRLFDLDLKIKLGVERSTLLTMFALVVVVTQRVVDHYVSADFGWIAAIAAAVALFLGKAKLDVLANRIADKALPQVQPTSAYIAFKKLEVYKAAVESAREAGGIDARERRVLSALRAKLGLAEPDCAAVEQEVLGASPGVGAETERPAPG